MWMPSLSKVGIPSVAVFRRTEPRNEVDPSFTCPDSARLLSGLSILHLGFTRHDGVVLTETIRRLGARQVAYAEQVSPVCVERPEGLRYDGIIVNLDRFGDIDLGVERLMRFRRARPSCFVIIATADVAMDDFGHHRRAICDSTLRLPFTASRLEHALESTLANHRSKPVAI